MGFKPHPMPGASRTSVGITDNPEPIVPDPFETMPGVVELIRVTRPYKLVSREFKSGNTIVQVGNVRVGGDDLVVLAGPCAAETEERMIRIAEKVRDGGAQMLRGGAFKPRASPYSFQGLELEGLKILAKEREHSGLPIVTEADDAESLDLVEEYADVIQIGARNAKNSPCSRKPEEQRNQFS
jgi:3-deoxy-7-phosphoheptulonate synthase